MIDYKKLKKKKKIPISVTLDKDIIEKLKQIGNCSEVSFKINAILKHYLESNKGEKGK